MVFRAATVVDLGPDGLNVTCSKTVYRTDWCPVQGYFGVEGECLACGVPPLATALARAKAEFGIAPGCPGGPRLAPPPGVCQGSLVRPRATAAETMNEAVGLLRWCVPPEACLGGADWRRCGKGYAPAGLNDTCCSGCDAGYSRVGEACVKRARSATTIDVVVLLLALAALGVVFHQTRNESLFLLPAVSLAFRTSQALALVQLDLVGSCHAPSGFAQAVLPAFAGVVDLLGADSLASATGRLGAQLAFTLVYLAPLLVSPALQWSKARRYAGRGLSEEEAADISAPAALARAVVFWGHLMLTPLSFILTGQLECEVVGLHRVTAAGVVTTLRSTRAVVANYPASSCIGRDWSAAAALSLTLFFALCSLVIRACEEVDGAKDEPAFRRWGFILGHCQPGQRGAWRVDLALAAAAVFYRSSASAAPLNRALLASVVIVAPMLWVALARPFVGRGPTAAYTLAFAAVLLAVWAHYAGNCRLREEMVTFDAPEPVLRTDQIGGSDALADLMGLLSTVCFFGSLASSAIAAFKSLRGKGQITIPDQGDLYQAMDN